MRLERKASLSNFAPDSKVCLTTFVTDRPTSIPFRLSNSVPFRSLLLKLILPPAAIRVGLVSRPLWLGFLSFRLGSLTSIQSRHKYFIQYTTRIIMYYLEHPQGPGRHWLLSLPYFVSLMCIPELKYVSNSLFLTHNPEENSTGLLTVPKCTSESLQYVT